MQNTMENITYNTAGSLNKLDNIITLNNINISASEILITLHKYLSKMTEEEQNIFKSYFLRQASISEIYNEQKSEYPSEKYIANILKTVVNKYITFLKNDYCK